jgi:glutathione S-transferase
LKWKKHVTESLRRIRRRVHSIGGEKVSKTIETKKYEGPKRNLASETTKRDAQMERYYAVAAVTLVFGLVVFGMALTVSRLHATTGILAPTTTGDPRLERAFRAHLNTVEWTPIFLPAMWIFAVYWSAAWAARLGALWLIGRVVYFIGYLSGPDRRFPGFFIQSLAAFALLLGALGRIAYLAM